MHTQIIDIDYYLPSEIVKTNHLVAETRPGRVGLRESILSKLTGVEEVRFAADKELPSSMAIRAAEKVFANSAIKPHQIDLIIFCGIHRDYLEPSTAHIVQAALGCKGVCFDVTNACLGFMTGIQIANEMIKSGAIRYALVCTGERSSSISKTITRKLLDVSDKDTYLVKLGALTLGDAGAAAIIGPTDGKSGFLGMDFQSFGSLAKLCYWETETEDGEMHMKVINDAALSAHMSIYKETLNGLNLAPADINCLIIHQTGKRPFTEASEAFGVDKSKMTKTFHILGNVTTATFPVNYAGALKQGRIKKGDLVLAAMAGSGVSVCQTGIRV